MAFLAPLAIGLVVVYVLLHVYLRVTQDSREPPVIETTIPFITPVLGLSKNTYPEYLRKRYSNPPISTLRLPGQRIYVVTSPNLIASIQRQYKIFSFQAVEDGIGKNILSTSVQAQLLIDRAAEDWRASTGNVPSPGHVQFAAMTPGKRLDAMNKTMVEALGRESEEWVAEGVGLYEWVKGVVMGPTAEGVFGRGNPYSEEAFRRDYWTFFDGVPMMVKGGKRFAKKSVEAQLAMAKRFKRYFREEKDSLTGLGKYIFEYYTERGFPFEDIAQLVSGTGIALLGNTLPTAFWWVLRLYSNPKVFEACRGEILAQVVHSRDEDGNEVRTLDITALKTACPLLNSAFKEVLRREAIGSNVRGISEDHLLDGKYLLRKGGLIFFPLSSQHFDIERWGADAEEYCFDRFADKKRPRVGNNSFRTFGGGTTLCPGRHFVTTELLAFAAMLLLRFEVRPKSGKWIIPTTINAEVTTTMPAPDFDVDVEIRKRDDDRGVKWVWELSESNHVVMGADQDEHGHEKA